MKHPTAWNFGKNGAGLRFLSVLLVCLLITAALPVRSTAEDAEQPTFCGFEEHTHTEECFERTLICGETESETHTHTEECYETVTICGYEAHTHTLECYADKTADVENATIWRSSVSSAHLTGDWRHDLVEIAETQLGYQSSERNYTVEEGRIKRYTRYGDWYGGEECRYCDWCAGFVSFCLFYANIRNVPLSLACGAWVRSLGDAGLYRDAADYTPKAGDLIFFCREDDPERAASHVGIVVGVTEDGIRTIEGNRTRTVAEFRYQRDESTVIGYGVLPENPNRPVQNRALKQQLPPLRRSVPSPDRYLAY